MKFEEFCRWPSLSSGFADNGRSAIETGWPSSTASSATCGSCSPSGWGCSSRKRNASGSENKQISYGYNEHETRLLKTSIIEFHCSYSQICQ
jgi:hypothetical protein